MACLGPVGVLHLIPPGKATPRSAAPAQPHHNREGRKHGNGFVTTGAIVERLVYVRPQRASPAGLRHPLLRVRSGRLSPCNRFSVGFLP